jgi:hypothetical protein
MIKFKSQTGHPDKIVQKPETWKEVLKGRRGRGEEKNKKEWKVYMRNVIFNLKNCDLFPWIMTCEKS